MTGGDGIIAMATTLKANAIANASPTVCRAPALAVAALALVACGCDAGPRSLPWQIRLADPTLAPRARLFEATIYLGGCADGTAIFDAELTPDGMTMAPAPPELAPGVHGFGAVARDSSCMDFASGCVDVTLPSSDAFVVELVADPGGAACPASQCGDGRCGGAPVDAGMPDAAQLDAGPVDAGSRDAGSRDAGPAVDGGPCPTGYDDCDRDPSNGCEVNLMVSKPNCGMCGNHCPGGALASCCMGTCVSGRCP